MDLDWILSSKSSCEFTLRQRLEGLGEGLAGAVGPVALSRGQDLHETNVQG